MYVRLQNYIAAATAFQINYFIDESASACSKPTILPLFVSGHF